MADKDPLDEFMALPRDQQLATLQQLPAPTQDKILGEVKTRITGLSANPNKKGIYAMQDENGNQLGISFDKVDEAGKYGFKFPAKVTIPNAKSREDYAKDRFAILMPNANTPSMGTRNNPLEGRFTKGGRIVPQTPIPEQVTEEPGAWQGVREAFQKAAVPTGENRPVSLDKTHSSVDSAWNLGANFIDKAGNVLGVAANNVFGAADMVPQIFGASKDALSYDPYKATTGLTTLMQMMPPLMAKNYVDHLKAVHKDNPSYATDDVIGTVMGIWASGKLVEGATKAVSDPVGTLKSIKKTPEKVARVTAEAVTRTGPREIKRMAEELQKANAAATEAHQNIVQPNAEKLVGDEIGHHADEKIANEKAAAEHQAAQEKVRAKNKETIEDHKKEVADVQAYNDRVKAKHEETARKIQEERDASEHALELRRAEEATLETAAQEQDKKYADAEKKATDDNNADWDKVRSKTAGHSTDISKLQEITERAADQADPATSALFKRIIKGEQPNLPSLTRTLTATKYVDAAGNPVDRMSMSSARFDDAVAKGEFRSEPVTETLNPDDPGYGDLYERQFGEPPPVGGGPAQFNRLQRWYSYIQDKMYSSWVNDGHLYKAYGIVRDAINDAMQDIAQQANATPDLAKARKSHTEKMETFHDSPNEAQTVASKSLREQTPEQVVEKSRAERLKKVARYDPSILDTAKKIDDAQQKLKGMKTEEQLRASLKQVPDPPAIGDPRDGYNLKEPPQEPIYTKRDATGKLLQLGPKTNTWSPALETGVQYQLEEVPPERLFTVQDTNGNIQKLVNGKWETVPNPRPQNLAHPTPESVQLERPIAGNLPDRPELGTITPEGYKNRVETNIGKAAESQREHGLRRATNALYYTIPTAIFSAIMSHPGYAIAELASTPAILGGSHLVANLIEKPEVVQWLSSVTDRHVAVWDKLPPEQKALFSDDMKQLIEAARKKGVKVSPALTKFVSKPVVKAGIRAAGGYAGAANANRPSVEELKRQAEELQKKFSGDTPPSPGPQSSNKKTPLTPQELMAQAQELQSSFHRAGVSPSAS